jgi:hypothetical protein
MELLTVEGRSSGGAPVLPLLGAGMAVERLDGVELIGGSRVA